MQFCPKCGSIFMQKKKRFVCVKCGYVAREKIKIATSESIGEKRHVVAALHEKNSTVWPITSATCPKCGHDEAYFWSAQMRSADEAETRFFRCTKCKHTWREYA